VSSATPSAPSALDQYRLFGASGLRVSPLCLGAMTFGASWGWGADEAESARMYDAYVDRGGNFIDTANGYTGGESEEILGRLTKQKRNRLVIGTKFTIAYDPGDPNSGGNHRKSLVGSVENSLRRLQTDYVDLLWMHQWEARTPPEEVMRALDDLIRQGKVLYVGASDAPAWRIAQMNTLAELRGWSRFVGLQIEYSLIERTVEAELMPMARSLGLGVTPWSPLGSGLLTGKYDVSDLDPKDAEGDILASGTRKAINVQLGRFDRKSLEVANLVKSAAAEIGTTSARLALAWLLRRPGVTAPIVGARTAEQLEENLACLEVSPPDEILQQLDAATAPADVFPSRFLASQTVRTFITGGAQIEDRGE